MEFISGKDYDFDKLLFRCHAIDKIMTDPRGGSVKDKIQDQEREIEKLSLEVKSMKPELKTTEKKKQKIELLKIDLLELKKRKDEVNLSATVKVHLIDLWTTISTGKRQELHNKYVKKGLAVEEDAITMLSTYLGKFLKKNTQRLNNEYLTGEMDTFEGEDILRATVNWDTKSNWDAHTFNRVKYGDDVNTTYYYQMQGYSDLNGAPVGKLFNALINTPDPILDSEVKKLWYAMGCPDDSFEPYIQGAEAIRNNGNYDNIPFEKRYHVTEIRRNDEVIEKIHTRVLECRHWMKQRFANA